MCRRADYIATFLSLASCVYPIISTAIAIAITTEPSRIAHTKQLHTTFIPPLPSPAPHSPTPRFCCDLLVVVGGGDCRSTGSGCVLSARANFCELLELRFSVVLGEGSFQSVGYCGVSLWGVCCYRQWCIGGWWLLEGLE